MGSRLYMKNRALAPTSACVCYSASLLLTCRTTRSSASMQNRQTDVPGVIPTTPLSLALRFSAFTMREIGLVIAPLDPRHKSEALFNRICMQGQHDLE